MLWNVSEERRDERHEFKTDTIVGLTEKLATGHDRSYRLSRVGAVGIYIGDRSDRGEVYGDKRRQGRRRGDED